MLIKIKYVGVSRIIFGDLKTNVGDKKFLSKMFVYERIVWNVFKKAKIKLYFRNKRVLTTSALSEIKTCVSY